MTPRSAFLSLAHRRSLVLGTAVVGLLSCARNPVTGKSELSLVSESQEIQMGQQAAQDVARSIGLYKDAKVESYVAGIGKRMAAASERPNLPWEFHVVDDASEPLITGGVSSRDVTVVRLEDSFHVATIDNDAERIQEESAAFVARVTAAS